MSKSRKRNPMARALRDPLFRPRRVPPGKHYRRRAKHRKNDASPSSQPLPTREECE